MITHNLCWIRRDLRLHDHHALSAALKEEGCSNLVFIFDKNILSKLTNRHDPRITFIINSLIEIEKKINQYGASLIILYGDPIIEIPKLVKKLKTKKLFFNRDYGPYAKQRDEEITSILQKNNIDVRTFKDHVFYEKMEVLNTQNEIYKVFTPYKNKWLNLFSSQDFTVSNFKCNLKKLNQFKNPESILKKDWYKIIHFQKTDLPLKAGTAQALKQLNRFKKIISNYKEARNFPALNQTSQLSPYLRMGNLSIRDLIRESIEKNDEGHTTWLTEIIWRDFYQAILDAFPHIENKCFKAKYDLIKWPGDSHHFHLWCTGLTGYPIVDAAMRCLNKTGLMHNRLRMIVASFLTKTLLIDWKLGEAYFAEKLLDYDMAANNGGWQWSASTGVDAQPYFRIFNPYNQSEKFDPEGIFIRQWCPQLKLFSNKKIHAPHKCDISEQRKAKCLIEQDYPHPIVSYKIQKIKALAMFATIKSLS